MATVTRLMAVHSDDREQTEVSPGDLGTNDIKVVFGVGALPPDTAKLRSIGCRSFTMPNHIYNVSDYVHPRKGQMNKIVATNGVFTYTGIVPKGHYSLSDLLTSLNSGGTTVWTGYAGDEHLIFTQNAVTGLVSCVVGGTTPNAGAAFYFPASVYGGTARRSWVGHLLGYHDYNAISRTPQVGIRQPNMIPHQHIYLCYVGLQSCVLPSNEQASAKSSGAIAAIPVNVPYGEMLIYQEGHPMMFGTDETKSAIIGNGLQFVLVDDEGVLLQNNNAKWEATLEAELGPSKVTEINDHRGVNVQSYMQRHSKRMHYG